MSVRGSCESGTSVNQVATNSAVTERNAEIQDATPLFPFFAYDFRPYRYNSRNPSTDSPATEMRFRMSPCLIGFPL